MTTEATKTGTTKTGTTTTGTIRPTADKIGDALRDRWIQCRADDETMQEQILRDHGVDFRTAGHKLWETEDFIYLPVTVEDRKGDRVNREQVVLAVGHDIVVTLAPRVPFELFDKAVARMRRSPIMLSGSAHGVVYALLWALNESNERVVELASEVLDAMGDEIDTASRGEDEKGRQLGVSDMRETMSRMNRAEEILSRVQESQLRLARAARHVRAEIDDEQLVGPMDILIADIDSVKQHAGFENEKVRFLQQSIMATLDVKQNEIVKVFTIITAVFLPPTLVATFYGMNFTDMPELSAQYGFQITTVLTLVAALIPLWYIKRQGWLR